MTDRPAVVHIRRGVNLGAGPADVDVASTAGDGTHSSGARGESVDSWANVRNRSTTEKLVSLQVHEESSQLKGTRTSCVNQR